MKAVVLLMLMMSFCKASAYQEGQAYAKQNTTQPTLESTGLNPSSNPVEASYTHESMRTKLEQEKQSNETFLKIKKAQKERPQYQIEVTLPKVEVQETDNGKVSFEAEEGNAHIPDFAERKCVISGETYTQTCRMQLVIDLVVTPQITNNEWYCPNGGSHTVLTCGRSNKDISDSDYYTRNCYGCRNRTVIVQPKKVEITKEEWVGCEDLEAMRDRGEAEVLSETPGPRNEERMINGEKITRDYFETTRVYALNTKVVNTCETFRILGCQLQESKCAQEKQLQEGPKICLMYEHTYQCPLVKPGNNHTKVKFGLDIPKGPPAIANQNMVQALSQLEAMKQMSNLKTINGDKVTFMKGDAMSCTTNFGGGFKDCCRSNGGFGTNIGLATGCSTEEKNLQNAKKERRCVFVGSRVKNKVLGINFSKEYRYCCFPSRLSLAMQSGVRSQLNQNFGNVDNPLCEGLKPDELTRVDLSQIDLSDTFQDIMGGVNKMQQTVQNDFKHLNQRFTTETREPNALRTKLEEGQEQRKVHGENYVY